MTIDKSSIDSGVVKLVIPVIDYSVRGLCIKEYPEHKKGCPNYNHKKGCPPQAGYFDKMYDLSKPVYAIINIFDFKSHVAKMKRLHPDRSKRKLECCLYWQPKARKELLVGIKKFLKENQNYKIFKIETCPEALGVNITETLSNAGFELEWPPVNVACQVALAAVPR